MKDSINLEYIRKKTKTDFQHKEYKKICLKKWK